MTGQSRNLCREGLGRGGGAGGCCVQPDGKPGLGLDLTDVVHLFVRRSVKPTPAPWSHAASVWIPSIPSALCEHVSNPVSAPQPVRDRTCTADRVSPRFSLQKAKRDQIKDTSKSQANSRPSPQNTPLQLMRPGLPMK